MTYPSDGLPRFRFTGRNILDRADCHRIVKTWETVGGGRNQDGIALGRGARLSGQRLCDELNADPHVLDRPVKPRKGEMLKAMVALLAERPMDYTELAEALGTTRNSVRVMLIQRLLPRGLVERVEPGVYRAVQR